MLDGSSGRWYAVVLFYVGCIVWISWHSSSSLVAEVSLVSQDTSLLDDVLQERYGQVQPWFAAVVGLLLLFGYSLAY